MVVTCKAVDHVIHAGLSLKFTAKFKSSVESSGYVVEDIYNMVKGSNRHLYAPPHT